MDGNSEQLQVINLKQLPIIEERLRDVKAKIEQRTSAVMALAVTEETRTDVKKIRTEVRKELEGYEAQRMAVKKAIMKRLARKLLMWRSASSSRKRTMSGLSLPN